MLGHASASMTLDTYGHLFEDRLDEVASAMDAARAAEREKAAASAREVAEDLMTQILASNPRPMAEIGSDSQSHKDPPSGVSAGQRVFVVGTPDRIRTRATALRGRRPRPLHNGGRTTCGTIQTAPQTQQIRPVRSRISLGY